MEKHKMARVPVVRKSKVPVNEINMRKAAARLLSSILVSTEVAYVQRELGTSATQEELDAKVVAVRALPWASIVQPD
jgi:hypothetical protein